MNLQILDLTIIGFSFVIGNAYGQNNAIEISIDDTAVITENDKFYLANDDNNPVVIDKEGESVVI